MDDASAPDETSESSAARRRRYEELAYAAFACGLTLFVAIQFYAQMRWQIFLSSARPVTHVSAADWSAPLDDVFIHFDFARSTARGHPFEWSEGNGYSSGGTSLLYPFILALGYLAGFDDDLMHFAGVLACVCVAATLLGARRLFRGLPTWTSYLGPVSLLAVGALDWTLFSGMEVALLLATWSAALVAWDDLVNGPPAEQALRSHTAQALLLGGCNALVVATRPEAATTVAVFSVWAAVVRRARGGWLHGLWVLILSAAPGATVVIAHAVANRVLTGDLSAAGAVAKLELHHPLLSREQVWNAWKHFVSYQVLRITEYHFSAKPMLGWIAWGLGAAAVISRRTRPRALLLWVNASLWVMVVALNGQVRWQNERYTMPAVAWLLLAAGLGIGALLSSDAPAWMARGAASSARRRRQAWRVASATLAVVAVGLFAWGQAPRMKSQIWFFGRASRNIRDQHVRAGRVLAEMNPPPRRVMLSDAGAIPFASDRPALDIIGLGGYHGLPFARASRWGGAAAMELVERLPRSERPDVMALYPGWWGDIPTYFGEAIGGVGVPGNVICGGATKMLYRAQWAAFEGSAAPIALDPSHQVVDSLDLADLVSEGDHEYRSDTVGFVVMKLLARPPGDEKAPIWDAGRILPPGRGLSFRASGLAGAAPTRVVLRLAPSQAGEIEVIVSGQARRLVIPASRHWVEPSVELPALSTPPTRIEVRAVGSEIALYHLWLTRPR